MPADTRGTMLRRTQRPATLEFCAACGADYVNPFDWAAVEDHSWWMHLRCAQCGHEREVVVGNAEAERFDEALDRREPAADEVPGEEQVTAPRQERFARESADVPAAT